MSTPERKHNSLRQIFAIPALLAVLAGSGLFAALLGNGGWDVLSWVGLGIPVLIAVPPLFRRQRSDHKLR